MGVAPSVRFTRAIGLLLPTGLYSPKLVEGVNTGVGTFLRVSDSPEIQASNRNSLPPRVLRPASRPSSPPQGGRHPRSPSLGEYLRPKPIGYPRNNRQLL